MNNRNNIIQKKKFRFPITRFHKVCVDKDKTVENLNHAKCESSKQGANSWHAILVTYYMVFDSVRGHRYRSPHMSPMTCNGQDVCDDNIAN